ncbi:MAG: chemotaxis protein CheB [Chloroflexota bacterium]
MTRVGIVNDLALVAEALRRIVVATPGFAVGWIAASGEEAVRLAGDDPVDVVLMDLVMPGMDGVEATRRIMRTAPCAILVVTATVTGNLSMVFEALGHGALDAVQTPGFRRGEGDDGTAEFRAKLGSVARLVSATAARARPAATAQPSVRSPGAGAATPTRPTGAVAAAAALRPAPPGAGSVATPARPATVGASAVPAPGAAAAARVAGAPSAPGARPVAPVRPRLAPAPGATLPPLVVIGASTGGPQALVEVLRGIGPGLPAAIVIVQHLDDRFSDSFIAWLAQSVPLPVVAAAAGARPVAGSVAVAIGENHLHVDGTGAFAFSRSAAGATIRPSADVLFESVAALRGARGAGVILTGMGRDGARGILALRKAGFHTIAQDAATSVIHGMPSAAIAAGGVGEVLPLGLIGPRVSRLMRGNAG